jgi:predicted RNase H-like nuclease (RuvC/YqgF family)
MKYCITLLFLLITLVAHTQYRLDRDVLPAYLIKGDSDTLGIIFSVGDVQKIDTNLELLEHFEKLNNKLDTTIYYYISLTNALDEKVQIQTMRIVNLTSQLLKQDEIIFKLKDQLNKYEKINKNNETIIDNKNITIQKYERELKKERTKSTFLIILGIILIVIIGVT